jgi:hypothetical protein
VRSRLLVSIAISIAVFSLTIAILLRLMPYPRKELDYLIIGVAATMVTMIVVFVILIRTIYKGEDIFFMRRRK